MPELKHTFSSGKMNKDLDERIVPNGEYRDANNIEVSTSEGSNVGVLQTTLGNTYVDGSQSSVGNTIGQSGMVPTGSVCVGSIADTRNDKIYWLVAGAASNGIKKDYVLEYDARNDLYRYVIVDIYEVKIDAAASSTAANEFLYAPEVSSIDTYNNTGIRLDMRVTSSNVTIDDDVIVTDIQFDTGNDRWKILTSSGFITSSGEDITFTSERLLNFFGGEVKNGKTFPPRLITGLNVMDGMLFWTDDHTEPKKINIERCIKGTGGGVSSSKLNYLVGGSVAGYASATIATTSTTYDGDSDVFHTRLVSSKDSIHLEVITDRLKQKAAWLEEEHITVIRKAPLTPPYLDMSNVNPDRRDANGNVNNISTILEDYNFSPNAEPYQTGDSFLASSPEALNFLHDVDFRPGDIIILTSNMGQSLDSFTEHEVRLRIDSSTSPFSQGWTGVSGNYGYTVLGISSIISDTNRDYLVRLEQIPPLFEFKFPRFAYRYKYKDGEYSAFSPFSEIAFLPTDFYYFPKEGYNLGMVNNLRSLKITDYIVENAARGQDVVEVDLLMKNEESPNIYTVKTIKPTDDHPVWPDLYTYPYSRGVFQIDTELIHAALPSNQLLRPWDNVPRKAKAQEVTASRLVYGNYIQNYNISDGFNEIKPNIEVSIKSEPSNLNNFTLQQNTPFPGKSVKSIRNYQVGVVYKDKYGRETPVLTGDAESSTISINKEECINYNKLQARITTAPPSWADSYKYFVKETSNEYYNLAMDRWYDADDGNVWISFPSAERNKVQEDTFLILKKKHDSTEAVIEKARYKVIAIEDEAPEYITLNKLSLGGVSNAEDYLGTTNFPFVDYTTFHFDDSSDTLKSQVDKIDDLRKKMTTGFLYVRLTDSTDASIWYKIANISGDDGAPTVKFTIDGVFGDDALFASPLQTAASIATGLNLEFSERKPEKKPEFDGRFFVKIHRDLPLQTSVLSQIGDTWKIIKAVSVFYINFTKATYSLPTGLVGSSTIGGNQITGMINGDPFMNDGTYVAGTSTTGSNVTYTDFPPGFPTSSSVLAAVPNVPNTSIPNLNFPTTSTWKREVRAWWTKWGNHWFIDSSMTANEAKFELDFYHGAGTANGNWASAIPNVSGPATGPLTSFGTSTWENHGYTEDPAGTTWIQNNAVANSPAVNFGTGAYGFGAGWSQDKRDDSIKEEYHGVFDGGTGPGTNLVISWSGMYGDGVNATYQGWNALNHTHGLDEQTSIQTLNPSQTQFIKLLTTRGSKFRFKDDPDQWVYTIKACHIWIHLYNYQTFIDSYNFTSGVPSDFHLASNKRKKFILTVRNENGNGIGVDGAGFNPIDSNGPTQNGDGGDIAYPDTDTGTVIEFVEHFDSSDEMPPSTNPAVFETEPKESRELDIYYEASQSIPININAKTNEQHAPIGSTVQNQSSPWAVDDVVRSWSDQTVTLVTGAFTFVSTGNVIKFTHPDGSITRLVAVTHSPTTAVNKIEFYGDSSATTALLNRPHNQTTTLGWYNCWSFGNGVESDRVRDDYNAIMTTNGVKASAVLAKHYEEERRGSGLIHSGIYNSTSGVNDLNQFIQAEPITKDLNPVYGSIQKLHNRDTNLIAFCEDKVFGIIADKNALFNADGSAQVVASRKVLGQTTPYAGDYGMSTNPESFATDGYRSYFSDKNRGAILRLSQDGLTPISMAGMKDWFGDNLKRGVNADNYLAEINSVIGSYDSKKSLYNVTINKNLSPIKGVSFESPVDTSYTLSYGEDVKGWQSFKSFVPESGLSINNEYYTFKDGELWKHHSNETRNNFYGIQYYSDATVILNEDSGSVKSFNTINYEGSQAKVSQGLTDDDYYNLAVKTGWYVDSFTTNLQTGVVPEFKNKEGKWFNYIRGETTTLSNLDQTEFSVQGIGMASAVTSSGTSETYTLTVKDNDESSLGAGWD